MGKAPGAADLVEKKEITEPKPIKHPNGYPTKSAANLSSYCFCVNIACFFLTIFSVGFSAILWLRISQYNERFHQLDARIAKLEAPNAYDTIRHAADAAGGFIDAAYDPLNKRMRRDISSMRASQRYGRQAAAPPTPSECTCPPGNTRTYLFS